MKYQNLVENLIDYYDSEDFKGNYWDCLLQDSHAVIDRIKAYFESYEFEKKYGFTVSRHSPSLNKFAELIYEHVKCHIDLFVVDAYALSWQESYIDSVFFGEQEEQLSGFEEWETDREALIEAFEESYFISGEYAYFDLSFTGLAVDISLLDFSDVATLANQLNLILAKSSCKL